MGYRFRHAICNEVYQGWEFADSCRSIKKIGYEGIEIAPFTLSEDPATIPADQRSEYKRIIQEEGLQFVGLHWLMVAPKGLHVTTPDPVLYERSWRHIVNLIHLCADLGDGGVMVFGSPYQRSTTGGLTREQATRRFVEGLMSIAPKAEERGVKVLVEALPANQTDVVLSLSEAVSIVREINSPAVQTMFDTHNAVDETKPHGELLEEYFNLVRHVHVNETDGAYCGAGDYDFVPVLAALKKHNYSGWVSLEAFKFEPGAETIATESLAHLNQLIGKLK